MSTTLKLWQNVDRLCYLDERTSLRIALEDVDGCEWSAATGENIGSVGDIGAVDIKIWELCPLLALSPMCTGIATCLGAVNGLYTCFSFCLWMSATISSAGSLTVGGGGDDSFSKNFTNNSEKDWKQKIAYRYFNFTE